MYTDTDTDTQTHTYSYISVRMYVRSLIYEHMQLLIWSDSVTAGLHGRCMNHKIK